MHEAGLHPLEVIRSATRNSAITLRKPELGLIQTGFIADLAIVDGNPLDNLHSLYAFGGMDYSNGKITYRGGVKWTIKGGVVYDNKKLIEEVLRVVRESKENWTDTVPLLFNPKN